MYKAYFNKAVSLFFILGFIFIPLTFFGLDYQSRLTKFLFSGPVSFIQHHLFPGSISNIDFSSDTIGLNILLVLLLLIALLLVGIFRNRFRLIEPLCRLLSAYYVAAILLEYGFDKIFKRQFPLPEPNILYSNFGSLTKDMLFWSTMGTSYSYSLATGIIEVLTAILILIKPTRLLGYCLATGVFVNILLINIGFDISVKLFSSFLLLVLLFNVAPSLKSIYAFFIQHKRPQSYQWIHVLLSVGIISCILFQYVFNDDQAERPPLHGAYQIERFVIGNDTLDNVDFPYERFFIHSANYIIFQKTDGTMIDYFFESNGNQLDIRDYDKNKITIEYHRDEKTGILQLVFSNEGRWMIESKSLNWKTLPALQDNMHYTIDEIK
jgi:hypothetical protein